MSASESKFIDRKVELPATLIERAEESHFSAGFESEAAWLRCVKQDLPKFIPFLTKTCGLEFRGRILEIGAGAGWLSAEISKLPQAVEIITTDVSAKLLKTQAPKVFKALQANEAKITRIPANFAALDFSANYFDAVVSSDTLSRASHPLRVLREVKRVLKPGGKFVAIREPVRPLVKLRSHLAKPAADAAAPYGYALSEYRHFFESAGLKLEVKRVVFSRGLKYYFDKAVNGLTHARYAFVATKVSRLR